MDGECLKKKNSCWGIISGKRSHERSHANSPLRTEDERGLNIPKIARDNSIQYSSSAAGCI